MMRSAQLCLLLLSCASALPAVVVSGRNDVHRDDWYEGELNPASFGELDGDGDGKVSTTEWKAGRAQLERALKETRAAIGEALDRDGSGKVSKFEASAGKPKLQSIWQQTKLLALTGNDADHDGKLSEAERKPVAQRCAQLLNSFGARVDTNRDQQVSTSEAETAVLAVIDGKRTLFSLCDRNNDGQLDRRESDLVFDLMRAIAGN